MHCVQPDGDDHTISRVELEFSEKVEASQTVEFRVKQLLYPASFAYEVEYMELPLFKKVGLVPSLVNASFEPTVCIITRNPGTDVH